MIKLKTINNTIVKPIPIKVFDSRPIKGCNITPTCYTNLMMIAPTSGGKTTALFEILKTCSGKNTKIIAFVSTLFNDDSWHVIKKYCKDNKIEFIGHTSIYEDDKDLLSEYVEQYTQEAKKREKKEEDDTSIITLEESLMDKYLFCDPEELEIKEKCQYPKTIFIFDDLANEIRCKKYENLLKKSRHFHILTITCSQDLKDVSPAAKGQIRIWLLFKNLNPERLQNIYDAISCNIPFEKFKSMYEYATREKYNFFYIDHRNGVYRVNFNKQFNI